MSNGASTAARMACGRCVSHEVCARDGCQSDSPLAAAQAEVLPQHMVRVEMVVFARAEDAKAAYAVVENALCVPQINRLTRGSCTIGKPRRITP
jgi:hypothetical protein